MTISPKLAIAEQPCRAADGADPSIRESAPLASIAPWITIAIVAANFILLALSLGDYRVSIDSGFHISLAQWYAHHGTAWWDHINYGPGGRPNLQGPGLHVAIAILGTILGGRPANFILANAILALAQWSAAIGTAYFFARRIGGEVAAMFAVAILAGAAFASASFYVGVPSGWVFIATPWAIYFFLQDRLVIATLIVSASCYTHLGGFATVPMGILLAAGFERRWRALVKVGLATAILTSPYSVHFLANLGWFRDTHALESMRFDPFLDLLAMAGFVWMLARRPRDRFLIAWVLAPIAWLFQDPYRFALQEGLAGSVVAALFLVWLIERSSNTRRRMALALTLVAIATLFPLGVPSLAGEISWDLGYRSPRMLNWRRARVLAETIERNHLQSRLIDVYENSLGSAIAVFAPVKVERGHWVEVRPIHDPADALSAGVKVYVVPLSPRDSWLQELAREGLIENYGGTGESAVITLTHPAGAATVEPVFVRVIADNARWLAAHAVNNDLLNVDMLEMPRVDSHRELVRREKAMETQRFHAGRMEVASLLYAYAMERSAPPAAKALRAAAFGFGEIASFLSDGDPIGDITAAEHRDFRRDMGAVAAAIREHPADPISSRAVREALVRMFEDYFRMKIPEADRFAAQAPAP
jgi:hypothetical protein